MEQKTDKGYKIIAHRGNGDHSKHNSLEAFRAAVKNPDLDGVEFDVSTNYKVLGLVLQGQSSRSLSWSLMLWKRYGSSYRFKA